MNDAVDPSVLFDVKTLAVYSFILAYIIDFASRIKWLSDMLQGPVKQIVATAVGVAMCFVMNISVIDIASPWNKIVSGIALSSAAGLIVSKGVGIVDAKRKEIETRNGG